MSYSKSNQKNAASLTSEGLPYSRAVLEERGLWMIVKLLAPLRLITFRLRLFVLCQFTHLS